MTNSRTIIEKADLSQSSLIEAIFLTLGSSKACLVSLLEADLKGSVLLF